MYREARRSIYASRMWRLLRKTACRRARGACESCGTPARRLEVHHLHPLADGGAPFPPVERLIALCAHCHGRRHGRVSVERLAWRAHIAAAIQPEQQPAPAGTFH